jgi:hypothetical protein
MTEDERMKDWIAREDYGDREQLERCWRAALKGREPVAEGEIDYDTMDYRELKAQLAERDERIAELTEKRDLGEAAVREIIADHREMEQENAALRAALTPFIKEAQNIIDCNLDNSYSVGKVSVRHWKRLTQLSAPVSEPYREGDLEKFFGCMPQMLHPDEDEPVSEPVAPAPGEENSDGK